MRCNFNILILRRCNFLIYVYIQNSHKFGRANENLILEFGI